jgi:ubiquinone/menaquinone biosynthesis C-methylase UbiE
MLTRQRYYDVFSRYYDLFVQLHSKGKTNSSRRHLAHKTEAASGDRVLDLCTGTGAVALALSERVGPDGMVVGVDFSRGMLRNAREKAVKQGITNITCIQADVGNMPFRDNSFAATTCSYAFYELKGSMRSKVLEEVVRTTRPDGLFCMMEHDIPENRLVRTLFYIRIYVAGLKGVRQFLTEELSLFKQFFKDVKKESIHAGRSKIVCGRV